MPALWICSGAYKSSGDSAVFMIMRIFISMISSGNDENGQIQDEVRPWKKGTSCENSERNDNLTRSHFSLLVVLHALTQQSVKKGGVLKLTVPTSRVSALNRTVLRAWLLTVTLSGPFCLTLALIICLQCRWLVLFVAVEFVSNCCSSAQLPLLYSNGWYLLTLCTMWRIRAIHPVSRVYGTNVTVHSLSI